MTQICDADLSAQITITELYSNKKRNRVSLNTVQQCVFLIKALSMIAYNYKFIKHNIHQAPLEPLGEGIWLDEEDGKEEGEGEEHQN